MVRVEAIELPVNRKIDACKLLQVQHHGGRVAQALLAGVSDEPLREWIAADQGGLYRTGRHRACTYWTSPPSSRCGWTTAIVVPREPARGVLSISLKPWPGASASAAATSSTRSAR